MLAIVFIFLISSFYIFNKTSCNLIVHPSLTDIFVENVRDNIFILPTKVTNKKLKTPHCSSDDDNSCHNINKDKYIFSQNINDVLENHNNEKVAYMHRNPFYFTTLNDNKSINIDLEIKKEECKIYKNKNNYNIFYNSVNFILDNVSFFFKKINKNKTNNFNQLIYPSYFIDINKTYILNQSYQINENSKHKIKGSRLGEHIDDLKTYSFIEPLSLAIDEINFNNFFENIWNGNRFNYIFLKEDKTNENINNNNDQNNEQNNYLLYNYDQIRKNDKINSLKNYAFDTQTKVKNLKNHLKESILENTTSSSIIPEEKTKDLYRYNDVENLEKINNIDFDDNNSSSKANEYHTSFDLKNNSDLNLSINKIFKEYQINEETDFEHVLMNNKKLNIGICTKEKKKKYLNFDHFFKNSLKSGTLKKIIFRKQLTKYKYGNNELVKYEQEYTCIFFRYMENLEFIFYVNKNREKKSLKFSDYTLYEKWKNKNFNKSKLSMLSTNILHNLKNYDYKYNKYIYKLHTDFIGVCKMMAPINMYKNKMLLDFFFNINICYDSNYISKHIYFDNKIKDDIILGGVWSYGISKKVKSIGKEIKKKYEQKDDKHNYIYGEYRNSEKYFTNPIETTKRCINNDNDCINKFISSNANGKKKSKIYIMEKVLNPNVEASKRFKRMKELNLYINNLEEKSERDYIIKDIITNNNGILLLSKKGFIKFKTPIVLSELYIEIHPNPLYNLICKNDNISDEIKKGGISKSQVSFSSNVNKEENKTECKYKNIQYIYLFFNFYINDNNKFNIKIDVNIEHLKKIDINNDTTPIFYLNVLDYLKNNIHQYRINKIEIEYSFYPISQKNAFFDHNNLPFYISLNNIIINKSEQIFKYIPIFFTHNNNFIALLKNNFKNYRMKLNQDISKNNKQNEYSKKINNKNENNNNNNNRYEQNEWASIFSSSMNDQENINLINDQNNEENAWKNEDRDYIFSDISNRGNSTNFIDEINVGKNGKNNTHQDSLYIDQVEKNDKNKLTSFNSFCIFTSLNEKMFYQYLTKYICTNDGCLAPENNVLKYNFYKHGKEYQNKNNDTIFNQNKNNDTIFNQNKNNDTIFNQNKNNDTINVYTVIKSSFDDNIEILPLSEIDNNIIIEKIQKEYFDSLKKEMEYHKSTNTVESNVAYNMKKIYFYEYIDKRYIIPPYIKGILINYEKKNEKFLYDLYNNLLYIIQLNLEKNNYNYTRNIFDTIYIYTALIPIESDLFNFNFLSENNLTLKQIQGSNTQTIFKNLIPFTKYDDFYTSNNPKSNMIKIKIMDFNLYDITENFVELNQGEEYQKNIVNLIKTAIKDSLIDNPNEETIHQ
ncbi:conserved Plasmodium protein, unknown function [Plasmodium berghei]|uniref:Uncharacterized protein n=2 Tax=Plasmodium berghei TaxID=5821 RepID=A0A509AH83_PLABA|nr:conserved Plasmodium protein, unknown function [Plasmodium berghei ANKA]CXI19408.1 conserved Plasmodium protein, unknown function [Plasmodium berghei]SCM19846.1 conserved Plasmodium protein, unknown function [Plasmodium berghei]SCN23584.1 conserved Plasmodium protein, unknown function [Plasmodium berghei]SCO59156.1 conserved Plasmodium protein, unknown function [Plasmodium berghei]SCO59928.1 conserved Plasmodium protein, unknown function [Plasmodium berghei]|eukprot:XP_034420669.1 conserved Plasmodium protein, unknown function [Plasmodium berghei ANKA]